MNNTKTQLIKNAVVKIDIDKINFCLKQNPSSKTLKQIISYQKRVRESNNDQEIFKLAVSLAYYLDTICDPDKAGYVKDKTEKKIKVMEAREIKEQAQQNIIDMNMIQIQGTIIKVEPANKTGYYIIIQEQGSTKQKGVFSQ
jgi:hypothetical protein